MLTDHTIKSCPLTNAGVLYGEGQPQCSFDLKCPNNQTQIDVDTEKLQPSVGTFIVSDDFYADLMLQAAWEV